MYFVVQWLQYNLKGKSVEFLKSRSVHLWLQLVELIGLLVAFQNLVSNQISLWLKINADSEQYKLSSFKCNNKNEKCNSLSVLDVHLYYF